MEDKLKAVEPMGIEENGDDGVFRYKLRTPVVYNGDLIEEVALDFEKLTGRVSLEINRELASLGRMQLIPALSDEYLIRMAAKASLQTIGSDFFELLKLRDYNLLVGRCRGFLLQSED